MTAFEAAKQGEPGCSTHTPASLPVLIRMVGQISSNDNRNLFGFELLHRDLEGIDLVSQLHQHGRTQRDLQGASSWRREMK